MPEKKKWAKPPPSVYTNTVFHENISIYQNILMMFHSLGFQEVPHFLWNWNNKCSVVWIICTGVQKKSGMFGTSGGLYISMYTLVWITVKAAIYTVSCCFDCYLKVP